MEFEIGDHVVMSNPTYGKNGFDHGYDLKKIPLGSKGQIVDVSSTKYYTVKIRGVTYIIHGDEMKRDVDEEEKIEKEYNNRLEKSLISDDPLENEETENIEREVDTSQAPRGLLSKISKCFGFLKHVVPESVLTRAEKYFGVEKKVSRRDFNPKYNAREEFVLWVREQFPDIGRYSEKNQKYPELEERIEEVYQAALAACRHGTNTAKSCIGENFRNYSYYLQSHRRDSEFKGYIITLLKYIEGLSPNFRSIDSLDYGTQIPDRILRRVKK